MSPKRDLLHEWMHRFEFPFIGVVRVWTTARPPYDQEEFTRQHRELEHAITGQFPIMEAVTDLPYVTAVEHLDESGNGRLVYVDWP